MKKLLSLPPNLVTSFHEMEGVGRDEYFCTSDPVGKRLGSGGGTTWLLEACRQQEEPQTPWQEWIGKEKRILLHAAGQSRRLPAYAPWGKVLTPIPVFRWARGQKLSQKLLDLQLPLYERIMEKAPASLHTLIASGDVYIRHDQPLKDIPQADVVCYGLWADPSQAVNHGVFLAKREMPEELDFMLQKPPVEQLTTLMQTHYFLLDIGIWLLSDKAISLLARKSHTPQTGEWFDYDLYGQFGRSLGTNPEICDSDFDSLTVAILPLTGGEFYHFGTNRELISSTLAIQNRVNDQRLIMHHKIKPHPAIFIQNAEVHYPLTAHNSEVWIENSFIPSTWELHDKHIITGIPENKWELRLPPGICVDVIPLGADEWVARTYGFNDLFQGDTSQEDTLFLGQSFRRWSTKHDIHLPEEKDIQNTALFPVCTSIDELGAVLRWMINEPQESKGREIWNRAMRLSANDITDQANLMRLAAQRKEFRRRDWSMLARNYTQSVFYQLDLADAAQAFAEQNIPLPPALPVDAPLSKQMSDAMFRARVLKLTGNDFREKQNNAFRFLREGIVDTLHDHKQTPILSVFPDQIVWGRSPVRIDLAGGWTDTPPYCLYEGGNVVNLAIELNGQPPLQVYIKPCPSFHIVLRSIDMGKSETITTWEALENYQQIGSPFSIPKAALALAGFSPRYASGHYHSLEDQLRQFGCGLEITLLAAIPAGSGLGTSSILAATVLGTLSDFCGLKWDKNEIANRTLLLEQLLTTGGGWQDQYGGILHGLKLLQTTEGFAQNPVIRWLPEYLFTDPTYRPCHLLYYTGITRTAKDILAEIVQGMFLNSGQHLAILREMKAHAMDMYHAIQSGDFDLYGRLIAKSWELNKALDKGTNPSGIEQIIHRVKDYCAGYKLPGAGGGGYLYMVAKDPEAAMVIRHILDTQLSGSHARFVEMNLSNKGLQISRS